MRLCGELLANDASPDDVLGVMERYGLVEPSTQGLGDYVPTAGMVSTCAGMDLKENSLAIFGCDASLEDA